MVEPVNPILEQDILFIIDPSNGQTFPPSIAIQGLDI